jgi:pyruvate dehydrogenase E2 component (dihydrolipoamide acetyltransferase)
MVTEIRMPRYGWTMTEGKIVKWLKKEGDHIEEGEPLFEVETEKVETEVNAITSGVLRKIMAPEGAMVPVGQSIGIISELGESIPVKSTMIEPKSEIPSEKESLIINREKLKIENKPRASPLAKKIAEKYQVNLKKVEGTGPGGRIIKNDVMRVVNSQKQHLEKESENKLRKKIVPLKGMRKIIAERMSKSAHTTARVLYTLDVDMTEALKIRQALLEEIEKKANARLSLTNIIVKAVSSALKQHSMVNSILIEDELHLIEDINIGVAVSLEEGLIVPVIHNADKKSLLEIVISLDELIKRAKQGNLDAQDTTGATFTITNPGMFGIDIQMPVINPPESAILGIGSLSEQPVVRDGQIVIKPIMKLNLVFDHRVLDGVPAAKFLQTLKKILENPYILLA